MTQLAYLNASGEMSTLDDLYRALSITGQNLGGLAFVLEQMLSWVILDLDIEQQELLYFVFNTIKEGQKRLDSVRPDGSSSKFDFISEGGAA